MRKEASSAAGPGRPPGFSTFWKAISASARTRSVSHPTKPAGASLAELAGGWSENEAREFEESVRVFEEIDQATWK